MARGRLGGPGHGRAAAGDLVLVDPLAVDLTPFSEILESDSMAVLHAADQDLEILEQVETESRGQGRREMPQVAEELKVAARASPTARAAAASTRWSIAVPA